MQFRPARIITAIAFGLALALLSQSYAPGQPSNDIQAKAAQLEKDLNATNAQVATLGQQLTAAQARVDEADTKIADAEARMKVGQDEIARLKGLINEQAASIYKIAGASSPFDAFNAKDAKDVTARSKYSDLAAQHDNALIDELAAAKQQLTAEKDTAVKARSEAADQRDAAAEAKAHVDAAASEQQRLLDQVNGEIEQALRALTAAKAEQARRAQDAAQAESAPPGQTAAAAPARTAGAGGGSPLGSGGAGAAAAYAQAQVGKAYCNTSERFGPNCFDCSGLTHSSWRAGGLEIPTVSGAQGSAYPHVSLSDLQPGDLITTSSWSAHVGIWVGGGYVHATSYSNNPNAVKFVEGTGSVVDAVRPY
ncbi:MAG: NlpC/P60 family protein [Actinomycetota bacterium]|nr:NlpC/P60 family protein [Actinomycetota bacterium]